MRTPWLRKTFKAYKITDIFSRKIVGYRVEERESEHLAVEMFAEAISHYGPPQIVHADSGPSMTSHLLRDYLNHEHNVTMSYNRAYVSNDNPFSEAGFKTMKYRPNYPGEFQTLQAARTWISEYVTWYNTEHRHGGIALFTPSQVADGTWAKTWRSRHQALTTYWKTHPERFKARPRTPAPGRLTGINLKLTH